MNTTKLSIVAFLCLLLASSHIASAQRAKPSEEEMQRIQSARIGMITNRLSLTPEQSKDFWPVYDEYSAKRRELNRNRRKLIGGKEGERAVSDQVAMANIEELHELKQRELDLDKEYQSKLLKVISASQLVELYKAEKVFNDMLLQRLKSKQK